MGYRATVELDSGYWWQDAITVEYDVDDAQGVFTPVILDTDIDDYTYPRITLTINSTGGDAWIINWSDDLMRSTSLTSLPANASVVINSEINYVTETYLDKLANRDLPRLLNGLNRLRVGGAVSHIKIEYNNRRLL